MRSYIATDHIRDIRRYDLESWGAGWEFAGCQMINYNPHTRALGRELSTYSVAREQDLASFLSLIVFQYTLDFT